MMRVAMQQACALGIGILTLFCWSPAAGQDDGGADEDPVVIHLPAEPLEGQQPQPAYPPVAGKRGITKGYVKIWLLVEADGTVGATRIEHEKPLGCGFGEEAGKAAMKWLFEPAFHVNKYVQSWHAAEFEFSADSTAAEADEE